MMVYLLPFHFRSLKGQVTYTPADPAYYPEFAEEIQERINQYSESKDWERVEGHAP